MINNDYKLIPLSKVSKNGFFRKVNSKGVMYGDVLTRHDYDRSIKKYEVYYESDISKNAYIKPTSLVAVDFIY